MAKQEDFDRLNEEVATLKQQLAYERGVSMHQEYQLLKRLYPYMANELDHFRGAMQTSKDAPVLKPDSE